MYVKIQFTFFNSRACLVISFVFLFSKQCENDIQKIRIENYFQGAHIAKMCVWYHFTRVTFLRTENTIYVWDHVTILRIK